LFFIISMVAAYTSRNLLFEQKTSANQLRATQSFEAADAGLQWALGMLNGGRITSACQTTTDTALTSFRQRYLSISATDGSITPTAGVRSGCVFNGTTWVCNCPTNGEPTVATPAGTDVFPAFRVQFTAHVAKPQVVRIEVVGCTRNAASCLSLTGKAATAEGRTYVTALLTLKGAISSMPVAALTARDAIDVNGLTVINANPKGSGITVQSGGTINTVFDATPATGLTPRTIAGGPNANSFIENDPSLAPPLTNDLMFNGSFGLLRNTYRDQPGTVIMACDSGCTAAQVRTQAERNPGRILWVDGDLSLDTAGDIGSATEPVAIVVKGNLQFAAAAQVFGLVYVQASTWNLSGTSTIQGAAVAEGGMSGSSGGTFVHDRDILNNLRFRTGTMVIVPGSWKDLL
jgi:hypothetical protein